MIGVIGEAVKAHAIFLCCIWMNDRRGSVRCILYVEGDPNEGGDEERLSVVVCVMTP